MSDKAEPAYAIGQHIWPVAPPIPIMLLVHRGLANGHQEITDSLRRAIESHVR